MGQTAFIAAMAVSLRISRFIRGDIENGDNSCYESNKLQPLALTSIRLVTNAPRRQAQWYADDPTMPETRLWRKEVTAGEAIRHILEVW